jgi:exosome complex exonuclease RRP6
MEDINASGIAALQDAVSKVLVATTRTAGQLSAEDLGFHRTMDPLMGVALDRTTKRLFKLSKALIKTSQVSSVDDALSLQDADDVETNWRAMVDGIDSLLERADTCLDEYTGLIKKNKLEPQMFNEKV